MTSSVSNEDLDCPRCGYDQRGTVVLWEAEGLCPLEGTCSECGLEFPWRRIFFESEHRWLFEYRWHSKPIASFWATLWRWFLPWKFWREVNLFGQIQFRPIVAMLVMILGLFEVGYFGFLLVQNHLCWSRMSIWGRAIGSWGKVGPYSLNGVFNKSVAELTDDLWRSPALDCAMVWAVSFPLAFLLLPISLRRAKVRHVHLLRIFCYSLLIPIPLFVVFSQFSMNLRRMHFFMATLSDYVFKFEEMTKSGGEWIGWVLRDVLRMVSVSSAYDRVFVYLLLPGLILLPFWWFACSRYLKLETPHRVMAAITALATSFVTAYVVMIIC